MIVVAEQAVGEQRRAQNGGRTGSGQQTVHGLLQGGLVRNNGVDVEPRIEQNEHVTPTSGWYTRPEPLGAQRPTERLVPQDDPYQPEGQLVVQNALQMIKKYS